MSFWLVLVGGPPGWVQPTSPVSPSTAVTLPLWGHPAPAILVAWDLGWFTSVLPSEPLLCRFGVRPSGCLGGVPSARPLLPGIHPPQAYSWAPLLHSCLERWVSSRILAAHTTSHFHPTVALWEELEGALENSGAPSLFSPQGPLFPGLPWTPHPGAGHTAPEPGLPLGRGWEKETGPGAPPPQALLRPQCPAEAPSQRARSPT